VINIVILFLSFFEGNVGGKSVAVEDGEDFVMMSKEECEE
jgi:hypothetical protein